MQYAKTIAAAVFALVVTVVTAVSDHQIDSEEWAAIAAAWAGVVAVFAVPNKPAQ
jgi:hypothetical protein